jgi:hypothetical protein
MSSVKFAAAIAAVLFMSASAAQAGGRPLVDSGMVSLPSSILVMSMQDRKQSNHRIVRPTPIASTGLASRHRPVSKPIPARFAAMVLERRRADPVNSSDKFTAPMALQSEKALAAGDIRFADRIVTSSLSRAPSTVILTSSLDFRIGNVTPSGAVKFAQNQPVVTPSIWIRHYISH